MRLANACAPFSVVWSWTLILLEPKRAHARETLESDGESDGGRGGQRLYVVPTLSLCMGLALCGLRVPPARYTTVISRRRPPVNRFFGIRAWTPRTISTTCVTRKLTAMLHSA